MQHIVQWERIVGWEETELECYHELMNGRMECGLDKEQNDEVGTIMLLSLSSCQ